MDNNTAKNIDNAADTAQKVDKTSVDSTNNDNGNGTPQDAEKQTVPLAELIKVRKEAQALKKQLEGFDAKTKKEAEAKLLEEKKYTEVIATKEAELEQLRAKAEQFDALVTAEREAIKESLGDKYLPEFDNMDITALKKVAKLLEVAPKVPDTDKTIGDPASSLTPEQKAEAERMNLSEDMYKRYLKTRAGLSPAKEKK